MRCDRSLLGLVTLVAMSVVVHCAEEGTCGPNTGGSGTDGTCTAAGPCDSIGRRLAGLLFLIAASSAGAGYIFYRSTLASVGAYSTTSTWPAESPDANSVEMRPTKVTKLITPRTGGQTGQYDYMRSDVDLWEDS